MASRVSECGRRPIPTAGLTTPASINTVQTITLPTTAQRQEGGILECTISVEGSVNARFTWNGTTPTAAIGLLLPLSNGGAILVLRGEEIISAFKIIGAAAGALWTYNFAIVDTR